MIIIAHRAMGAVAMKTVLFFALLVCANCLEIGRQNDGASSCNPITIDLHGNVIIKESNKPSAHIEASNRLSVSYPANHVIKDWSTTAPHSHLADGMKYNDGRLTVPTPGLYYIYAQIYYQSTGRVHILVNNRVITMIQPPSSAVNHGTLFAGGVYKLNAGDVISSETNTPITVYMDTMHSYFGAFKI